MSVPFGWEAAPGVPKQAGGGQGPEEAFQVPNPPPGRWAPPVEDAASCSFSGAEDEIISPDTSIGCNSRSVSVFEELDPVGGDDEPGCSPSPGFMIRRFLPAAEALAAAFAPPRRAHPLSPAGTDLYPWKFKNRRSLLREDDADDGSGPIESPGWGLGFLGGSPGGVPESAARWTLPPLHSPSEPWLCGVLQKQTGAHEGRRRQIKRCILYL
ncbi:unnamed protein product [Spirodela intermedia]|uniref:Uncharacterized protein n=1 Tax=Spirodela intermedia TaxID=51605 RepID=A0A7I8IIA8_SPIIN|nr:unnamed protein product [Spirodela intermedia]CAA6656895.1 unnamed protein product [Spirodela intermedia]